MTDTQPHGYAWHFFDRLGMHHQHSAHWRVVHYGFFSTFVFTGLIGLEVFGWNPFESHYVAIAILYMLFQLAEVVTRDALDWAEVIEGSAAALVPAIVGVIAIVHDSQIMTSVEFYIVVIWTTVAWTFFIFGLAMGVKMPTVASRRTESVAPKT